MATKPTIAIKVDVDTDRGSRIGVPNLVRLFEELNIPATFLFTLGPDNTGRALKRVFRKGFFKKVSRTNVISNYGIRTLLYGVLIPAPNIAKRNKETFLEVQSKGHEVGIHAFDHVRWQDYVHKMTRQQVFNEFEKAKQAFEGVFSDTAKTAGTAGWQANANSFAAYDAADLLYGSDTRGVEPYFPSVNGTVFKTLQIPSTLPTLDELLGREEYPINTIADYYLSILSQDKPNIFTVHAELEGMNYIEWFKELLQKAIASGAKFSTMQDIAKQYLQQKENIPTCEVVQKGVDGRSGNLAMQEI